MGFRFNKSINLGGGFRVNLSKSGLGYSWGTKGARFTKTAKGRKRTTLSIPGTGLSYITESKNTSKKSKSAKGDNHMNNSPEKKPSNGFFKKTILWILAIFFIITFLVFFPSLSSFLAIITALLLTPIKTLQNFISKYLNKTIKTIAIILLIIFTIALAPNTNSVKNTDYNNTDVLNTPKSTAYAPSTDETVNKTENTQHEHTFVKATCTKAETCEDCGEEKGNPLGHKWKKATCETPKTCTRCNETKGKKLSHNWTDATCESPKTCAKCNETKGKKLGHNWDDATCESPKTCTKCNKTKGKKLNHSWTDATCESPKTCILCNETTGQTTSHDYYNGTCVSCSSSDPNYVSEAMVWISIYGGTKYHSHSDCSNMNDPQYVTKGVAISKGFDACKRCY